MGAALVLHPLSDSELDTIGTEYVLLRSLPGHVITSLLFSFGRELRRNYGSIILGWEHNGAVVFGDFVLFTFEFFEKLIPFE